MKHVSRVLSFSGLVAVAMALVVPSAFAADPAPGYEEFRGCPTRTENPNVRFCVSSVVTEGHFQMGSKNTPITDPITLTGGTTTVLGEFVFTEEGGLREARQEVPGGLVGLTGLDWLVDVLGAEALEVHAVTEMAGTMTNPTRDPFTFPIKVRLENPVLGDNCYVGSDANPIVLNLTRGTTNPPPPNQPITGQQPTAVSDPNLPFVVRQLDAQLVDNAFAAPAANGCRLQLGLLNVNIDNLVNLQSGLPSPAGTNETRQFVDAAIVRVAAVYPPQGF
jgi:hypothetical protein